MTDFLIGLFALGMAACLYGILVFAVTLDEAAMEAEAEDALQRIADRHTQAMKKAGARS